MSLLHLVTFWVIFLVSQCLMAQTPPKSYAYTLGAKVYKGLIMKHNANIGHLAVSHPQGISLYLNKHTFGKKFCEQVFHYPSIGIGVSYFDYLNPVLGKSLTLTTYLDVPFIQMDKSFVTFKLATGLAYHTHPHHQTYNNTNIALGTRVTYAMVASFRFMRQITEVWESGLALSLTHFSNGAFSKPNAGINIPTLELEMARKIKPVSLEKTIWDQPEYLKSAYFYYLGVSTGLKEIEYGGDRYSFINLHFLASKRFSAVNALNLGLDAFVDYALKAHIHEEITEGQPDFKRVGFVVGHELFYDRLSLLTQIGTYFYRPYKGVYGSLYQRYGLRYALTNRLISSINLKVHGGQAEMVEWGLGLQF